MGLLCHLHRSIYYGLTVPNTNTPDGIGTLLSKNRECYAGEFCSGVKHGWGMGIAPSEPASIYGASDGCIRYEGVWDNGSKHGYGFLRVNKSIRYYGQFHRNLRHGAALIIVSEGREKVWRTMWNNNVCISKSSVFPRSPQSGASPKSVTSSTLTATKESFEAFDNESSEDEGSAIDPGLRPELWTANMVAAALEAACVDPAVCTLFIQEQVNGRVLCILMAVGELSQGLRKLGITNPYVRRYCLLILYGIFTMTKPLDQSGSPLCSEKTSITSTAQSPAADLKSCASENMDLNIRNLYLEKRIGEGGYGRVYRGRYDFGGGLKIAVACKVFRPSELWKRGTKGGGSSTLSFVLGPNMRQGLREFEAEVANHRRLHHPNIVKHYGVIRHPLYCVISEYVPCGSLFDLLHHHNRKLSLNSWLKISEQIAYSLAYLHSRNIIHCDLKTSNILITQSGDVKLCDFGLAHRLKSNNPSIGCIGTVQWMSPESLRGESLGYASDIYSFGIILWEILTGEIPYKSMPQDHILTLVGYSGLSILTLTSSTLDSVPPNILNVIKSCLHPDPQKRPTAQNLTDYFKQGRQSKFFDFEQNLKTFFGL